MEQRFGRQARGRTRRGAVRISTTNQNPHKTGPVHKGRRTVKTEDGPPTSSLPSLRKPVSPQQQKDPSPKGRGTGISLGP